MEPTLISPDKFFKLLNYKPVNLLEKGLYSQKDIDDLAKLEARFAQKAFDANKILKFIFFSVKNPDFIFNFLIPRLLKRKVSGRNSLKTNSTVVNGNLKANIVSAFRPKRILEIGTYLGWGAGAFKYVAPRSSVFSINPRNDQTSNNPIPDKYVGIFYRKKKLEVKQLWGDSNIYNFNKLSPVDVSYIDGNHNYEYVYKDLEKCSDISRKSVVLDDYLPSKYAKKYGIPYGPWNEGVVFAVRDYLKNNTSVFKQSYLVKGSPYCVLIK